MPKCGCNIQNLTLTLIVSILASADVNKPELTKSDNEKNAITTILYHLCQKLPFAGVK